MTSLENAKDLYIYNAILADGYRLATKQDMFMAFAPGFNFELDADQIARKAVAKRIAIKVSDDQYLVSTEYLV